AQPITVRRHLLDLESPDRLRSVHPVVDLVTFLPLVTALVAGVFCVQVFRRWASRPSAHLLLWGIGLVFYSGAALMQAVHGLSGWDPLVFRLWYLGGAILVAAWLGQGTVHLLTPRPVAWGLLAILVAASGYAAFKVFAADLDPALLPGSGLTADPGPLSGEAITSPGVRALTPFFNVYGVLWLAGGAIWSAMTFFRRGTHRNRAIGNLLIAAGALGAAGGGTLQRLFSTPVALSIGNLLGALLLFAGFLVATRPDRRSE
ncbi:MAG: hypothetical protein ACRDVM_01865, partial [Acidimicrobiia bacterium]